MIYSVNCSLDLVDFDLLSVILVKRNINMCIGDDVLYLYCKNPKMVPISNIMRELKIKNYFFKELTSPPTKTPTNYVQTWLLEKFQEQEMAKFNEQHQAELQKAQENIKKAQEEFLKVIEEYYNQGGAADGRK